LWPFIVLQPNLVPGCTLIPHFSVPNFKVIRLWICVLWQLSHLDTKKKKPIFEGSYLGNTWHNLVEIWWWCWPVSPLQKSFGFIKVSWSYVYVKIPSLFFLLINHRCGRLASWATWHTTVCLDTNIDCHKFQYIYWYHTEITNLMLQIYRPWFTVCQLFWNHGLI